MIVGKLFKARIKKGRIEPADPAELPPEGTEVFVSLEESTRSNATRDEAFERALADFRSTIGALKGIRVEERVADIYRAREEGTRPAGRP
jgi:DNA topoisomerase IB